MKRQAAALAAALLVAAAAAGVVGLMIHRHSSPDGLASGPGPGIFRGSEPPSGIHASDFTLRSYRGDDVHMASLRGRVVLLTFLDTRCTEKCPVIAAAIGSALRLLSPRERSQIVPLAITVEPHTDSPSSVRRFLRRRHALALDFLLGTPRELRPVWKAYGIVSALDTGNADVHSSDVRIVDRRGIWVSTLHAGLDLTPANLAYDLRVAFRR